MRAWIAFALVSLSLTFLGMINAYLAHNPIDVAPIPFADSASAGPEKDGKPSPSRPALQPLGDQTGESLLRPLFHVDRRPFQPIARALAEPAPVAAEVPLDPPEPASPPPSLRLAGISLANGYGRALLGREDGSQARWVSAGESVEGWTVTAISSLEVTLTSGVHTVKLALYGKSRLTGIAQ